MKINLKSFLFLAAAVCAAPFISAQVTLHDFTAFQSPATTVFVGDWALNGNPIGGDSNPIASFSQGAGFYNFIAGTNADTAGAYYFLPASPGDLTGYGLLQISARLLDGNTAPSFAVSLLNFGSGETAVAFFDTAGFAGTGFTTLTASLTSSGSFDPSAVDTFLISGGSGGTGTFNLAIDHLSVARVPASASVPEPATHSVIAMAVIAMIVLSRSLGGRVRAFASEQPTGIQMPWDDRL